MSDHNAQRTLCGAPYPGKRPAEKRDGGVVCVKPPGHDGDHATLLGIHPEHEDGWGNMNPSQEEWDYWPQVEFCECGHAIQLHADGGLCLEQDCDCPSTMPAWHGFPDGDPDNGEAITCREAEAHWERRRQQWIKATDLRNAEIERLREWAEVAYNLINRIDPANAQDANDQAGLLTAYKRIEDEHGR